jgi:hypothetical protein
LVGGTWAAVVDVSTGAVLTLDGAGAGPLETEPEEAELITMTGPEDTMITGSGG